MGDTPPLRAAPLTCLSVRRGHEPGVRCASLGTQGRDARPRALSNADASWLLTVLFRLRTVHRSCGRLIPSETVVPGTRDARGATLACARAEDAASLGTRFRQVAWMERLFGAALVSARRSGLGRASCTIRGAGPS